MSKARISELIIILSGGTPKTSEQTYWNGEIKWLSVADFKNANKYVYSSEKTITAKGLKESSTQMLQKNDIIISARGTVGKLAILKEPMAFNQSCFGLRAKPETLNQDFLFYYLKNEINNIAKRGQGSVFNTIVLDTFDMIDMQYPNIQEQQKLSQVLSTLDNKIESNLAIISKLEEMAKMIYEYWFLQFDFPNHEGKPYASSGGAMKYSEELKREIPINWEVKYTKHFCEVQTGSEDANFATPQGRYKFFTCAQETYQCDTPAFEGHAVLVAGNGDFNVKHYSGEFNAYQRTYVLLPKKQDYALLYFAVQQRITHFKKGSNGSIVKFIRKGDVENIPIPYPQNTKMLDTLNQFILMKEQKLHENQKLSQLRDWLLPMLMNGQARVE